MSLFSAAERFSKLDHSAIVFNTDHCLHSQDRYSTCTACLGICPSEAITAGKPPTFTSEKCQRCLACLTVCPVGAYTADDEVASLLNAATHLEGGTLDVLCEKNPQASIGSSEASTGIRVSGCLAGLGSGAYLALTAFGLERVLMRTDACAGCEWATLPQQVEEQIDQAKQLLEGWGKAEMLEGVSRLDSPVERPFWEVKNPPLSRRDLFRLAVRQGQIALARSMEDGQSDSSHRLGRGRRRMLSAIAHLPAPDRAEHVQLDEKDFAVLSVSEACTACAVCARACPTSALQFEKNEEKKEYKLIFSARNCVGCDICVHVCAPSAITLDSAPTFMQIFSQETATLHEGALVKCTSCGALTAAGRGVSLCPLCQYRRAHPFGAMLPPGLKGIHPLPTEDK